MSTLENAVSVLRLFSTDRHELTVTATAQLLKMPKSSVGRLLSTMRDVGLLEGGGRLPRYQVGPLFFEIAQHYRIRSSLLEQAEEVIGDLSRVTGHTGYVSILQGSEILVIRVRSGTHALRVVTPPGQRLPAAETANGRSLLARLTDDQVRALYPSGLTPSAANSPQSTEELLRSLTAIRRRGWAESLEEAVAGTGSTSIAIEDPMDREVVGVCLTYSASVQRLNRNEIARLLVEAGRTLGSRVGDPFWMARKQKAA